MMLSRKWLLLALLFSSPAWAGINNPGTVSSGGGGTTGSAQINIGSDLLPANFLNILGTGTIGFSGGATPGTAALDSNGYPTQAFTGTVGITFPGTIWPSVNYTFTWTSGTKLQITNLGTASSCSLSGTGGSTTGCSGGNVTLTIDGTGAGSMTWAVGAGGFSLQFPGTGTYGAAGTASLTLSRASDVGLTGFITPEYKAALVGLNPKTIRTMGIDGVASGNEAKWAYRAPPAAVAWTSRYPLGAWAGGTSSAGTITGTDQYTSAAAPDTSLAGWVANEVLMGSVSNASTALITVSGAANNGSGLCRLTVSTSAALATNQQVWVAGILDNSTNEFMTACSQAIFTITVISPGVIDLQGTTFSGTYKAGTGEVGTQTLTITGKTGGAKFIADRLGYPPGTNFGDVIGVGIGVFVYDSILDKVIYSPGAIQSAVPIEVQASIANAINANLWSNIPAMADDNFVTNWATAACNNLNSGLYLYPEYTNEVWNFNQTQTPWALNRGVVLGFPQGSNEAVYGWYALRVRQIMGNLIPAACGGHKLRRTLMFQGGAGNPTNTQTFRLNGADLAPSGTSTGKGNAAYNSLTGSANYTSSPNRPVDVVDVIGYAPYVAGTNFSDQQANGGTIASSGNASFLQTLATAFNSNPNDPTSIASLDNDQRQGTVASLTQAFTCPTGTTVTLNSNGFTNTASNGNMVAVVTAAGGTQCGGLSLNTAYCFINVTTNTFQLAAYTSAGVCGATPISLTPGTGTSTIGPMNGNTILSITSTWYPMWETMAASYDGGRTTPLRVEAYEGAIQPVTPSVATLTSIGVTVAGSSTTAQTALQNGLIGWKNASAASATQQFYFSDFELGAFPHSKTPSHLVLPCGGQYSLLSTCFPNSAPYQLYNGFAAFHGAP